MAGYIAAERASRIEDNEKTRVIISLAPSGALSPPAVVPPVACKRDGTISVPDSDEFLAGLCAAGMTMEDIPSEKGPSCESFGEQSNRSQY
jgi:hypothetical protein